MASGDNSNHNLPPSQFTFKAHSLSALPANNFKFASNPPPSSSTQTQSQTAAGRPISSVGPASVEGHANGNNARQASRASGNSYLGEPQQSTSTIPSAGTINPTQIRVKPPTAAPAPTSYTPAQASAAAPSSSPAKLSSLIPLRKPAEAQPEADKNDSDSDLSEIDGGPLLSALPPRLKPTKSKAPRSSSGSPVPGKRPSGPRASQVGGASNAAMAANKARLVALPHHHIVEGRGTKDSPHTIVINDGITDANSAQWPSGNELVEGNRGVTGRSYYLAVPENEGRNLSWRIGIANLLAEMLLDDDEYAKAGGKDAHWVLDSWPEGYKFFIHYSGTDRTDSYLFGSYATKKFRTIREFAPHLYWLLENSPEQDLECICKYCSKSTQTTVNQRINIADAKRESSSVIESPKPAKKPKVTEAKPKNVGSDSGKGKEKEKELKKSKLRTSLPNPSTSTSSGATTKKTGKEREREKSISPIHADGAFADPERDRDLTEGPRFRTQELVWCKLPLPLADPAAVVGQRRLFEIAWWPAVIKSRSTAPESTKKMVAGKMVLVNSTNFKYSVRLLALSKHDDLFIGEGALRPWLAYLPRAGFFATEKMLNVKSIKMVWNGERCYRPKLRELDNAGTAATTFALAMQIAGSIVSGFSLCDRYSISIEHIQVAEDITPAEREEIDTHLKNWHFQSLWWGGEKIWNGELVRLMADAHVFQSGTSPITPTNDPQEVRLFFKISSIYKDSAYVLQDGEQPPAKMVGQLYELVETALVKNGKMKESMTTLHDEYFPEPPTPDYTFRRHGAADTDVHLELEYIAGRYYFPPARLRSKEAIAAVLARDEADIAAAENGDEAPLSHDMRLLTLAGVVPAYRLYMKCHKWKKDRLQIFEDAETAAVTDMTRFLKEHVET